MGALRRWSDGVRSFHDDEDGKETIETVMLLGIGALALLLIIAFWKPVSRWWKGKIANAPSELPTE